jgi:molybdate transport system substrate-binding protein
MTKLSILSGGAAHGLIAALEPDFSNASGQEIDGTFGAVGAMRAKLQTGHPTDLVILTSAIVRELADAGVIVADTVTDIGGVATAIAVRAGGASPLLTNEEDLRTTLLEADAIYFPDPAQATAGIHFASVMERIGIKPQVALRLKTFPNGATAMRALAASSEVNPIGCTQVTEILATPGVRLVAPLPPGLDLTTTYTAGIVAKSTNQAAAQQLITLLSTPANIDTRTTCGFI